MPQYRIIDFRMISEKDPRFFHGIDPCGDGWRGNEDALGNAFNRSSGIFLENGKNFKIYPIEQVFHSKNLPPRDDTACSKGYLLSEIPWVLLEYALFRKSAQSLFHFSYICYFTLFNEKKQENLCFL